MTGAAGAHGGYVVQLAKAEGLTVIADASEKDEKLVASLGADIVVRRGDDVASRIRGHFPQGVDGLADGAVLNELVVPAVVTVEPSRRSADFRASRSGTSTSQQPLCALTHRSSKSSIGSGNRSRPARSPFAWRRSIRRNGRPMPTAGWRLAAREDGWSFSSNPGRQAGETQRAARRHPSTNPGVLLTGAAMISPVSRTAGVSDGQRDDSSH